MGTAVERVPSRPGVESGSRVFGAIFNRKVLAAALVLALVAGGLYWFFQGSDALAAMTVRADSGRVEVVRDGEAVPVDDRFSLVPGDVIRTAAGSVASLRLEGARRLQLLESSEIRIAAGNAFQSLRGKVLTTAGARIEVGVGDVSVTTASAKFRIDNLTGSARAGVYQGQIAVDGVGSSPLNVPALYQTSMTGGRVFELEPYALDENDIWDARILGQLVAFEDDLGSVKQGFAAQLGGSRPDLAYFGSLTKKKIGFMKPYLAPKRLKDGGYTADLMVAFMVATHAPGPTGKAFQRAYRLFFQQDATWGIAAGIVMKNDNARLERLVVALEKAFLGTGVLAGGAGAPDFALAGDGSGSPGGGPGGSGSTGGSVEPGGSTGGDGDGSGSTRTGDDGNTKDDDGGDDDDGGGGDDPCLTCAVEDILPKPTPAPPLPPLN